MLIKLVVSPCGDLRFPSFNPTRSRIPLPSRIPQQNKRYYRDKDINTINYWAHTGVEPKSGNQDVPHFSPSFSFSKAKLPQDDSLVEIKITPLKFSYINQDSSLTTIRNKWFVNLSSVNIPHDVLCLLQLGENFSISTNKNENVVMEFIKSIECNTNKFNIDTQLNIRNRAIP